MSDPGEGYRLIDRHERRAGDEWTVDGGRTWKPTNTMLAAASKGTYRRRIEPEEESVSDTPQFKVGDKVRVVRKDEGWEHWAPQMDKYAGRDGHVRLLGDHAIAQVDFGDGDFKWWFPLGVLSKLPEPPEGYRLLEPGETVREGDVWVGNRPSGPRLVYFRRIEQPSDEAFKLEPGKWYQTRVGEQAWVYGPHPDARFFTGFIETKSSRRVVNWTPTGRASSHQDAECDLDIIGPWTDEPTDAEIAELRLRAWIRDYGQEKQPSFIHDLETILDAVAKHREEHDAP